MKKLIVTLSLLVTVSCLQAQNIQALFENGWEIEAFYAQQEDIRISFYHQDSTNNTESFEGILYQFLDNGFYDIFVEDSLNRTDEWEFYSNNDSLILSGAAYRVVSLTASELIVSYSGVSFNLPLDYFFVLKPNAILATSNTLIASSQVQVFPIPVQDKLTLRFNNAKAVAQTAILYALDGRITESYSLTADYEQIVSLNNTPSGAYILKLVGSDGEVIDIRNIIINRK